MSDRLVSYKIHGLDCAEEVATLSHALRSVVAEGELGFDVLQSRMMVPASVAAADVVRLVAETGMRAEPWVQTPATAATHAWQARDVLTVLSGVAVVAGFVLHAQLACVAAAVGSEGLGPVAPTPWPVRAAYLVAIGAGLWLVLPKAVYAARRLRPDMNLLMTVAVAGAVSLGEFFEAGTVAFLFALSLTLEAWSVGKARRAVAALMSLAPALARVRRGDDTVEVAPADVAIGEQFVVFPGERLALDGIVVEGQSDIDQAPITGESVPVAKVPGDEVFAGTINGAGVLDVRSSRAAQDTTLARIARLVADSQRNRSQAEQWVERFARIYTPAVFVAALLVALVPPLLLGGAWAEWQYRALVLLVIGCPCALVISTPVAIVASLAAAANAGVLVKGGRLLEIPASIDVVTIDKTGTLTQGRPTVVEIVALGEHDEAALLARAAAIEVRSEHPIAKSILAYAASHGVAPPPADNVRAVVGLGAEGQVAGRLFWLGSHRWLEQRGQETPALHERIEQMAAAGRTIVVIGNESHVCGLIAVADALRDDAVAAVAALHRCGVRQVIMLTGDNAPTARAIAAAAGIDDVRSDLLPEDKVAVVAALEQSGLRVAMVGDGVNDAPALARASLGVAMGAAGTDVAIETADVALMGDDLGKLAWLIGHSRRTLAIIKQNTVFALAVKVVVAVATFAGAASLWGAIAADIGASLLVVFNALRLLRAARR